MPLYYLYPAVAIVVFLSAAYGWGRFINSLFDQNVPASVAYHCAVGLTGLIFVGGFLNLFFLALPTTLNLLLGLGVLAAVWFSAPVLRRVTSTLFGRGIGFRSAFTAFRAGDVVPWLLIIWAVGYEFFNLVPAYSFDLQDDFTKYIAPVFQMRQTGRISGGVFQEMGLTQLGSQTYLQSFLLTRLPFPNVYWFDFFVCSFLAKVLINDIGRHLQCHWFIRALGLTVFLFINPQVVNVTALYSGTLFILAIVYAALILMDVLQNDSEGKRSVFAAVPVGAMAAVIVSLKATLIPFALLFCLLLLAGIAWLIANYSRMLVVASAAFISFLVVLLPWMFLSTNTYFDFVVAMIQGPVTPIPPSSNLEVNARSLTHLLFSQQTLFWGGTLVAYNVTVLAIAIAAIVACLIFRANSGFTERGRILPLAVALISAVVAYLVNAELTHLFVKDTIRYSAPFLIATLPLGGMILAQYFWKFSASGFNLRLAREIAIVCVLGLQILIIGFFFGNFSDRLARLRMYGSPLAYSVSNPERFQRFLAFALSDRVRSEVRRLQSLTSPGEGIFAWLDFPFYLEFERNPLSIMESAKLVFRAAGTTFDGNAEAFRRFLLDRGVRYVVWQFGGSTMDREDSLREESGIPILAEESIAKLKLIELLKALGMISTVMVSSNGLVMLDLQSVPSSSPVR